MFFGQDYVDTCKTQINKVKHRNEDVGSFVRRKSSKESKCKKRKVNKKNKKHKKQRKSYSSSSSVNIRDNSFFFQQQVLG